MIHRRGKDAAAVVSIEDLRLLEGLVREAEDRIDAESAAAARMESEERIPYSQVRRESGITGGNGKRPTGVRD